MDIIKIEDEIRIAILNSADQYVHERAVSECDQLRLVWAFSRACLKSGGAMAASVLNGSPAALTPTRDCLSAYSRLLQTERPDF